MPEAVASAPAGAPAGGTPSTPNIAPTGQDPLNSTPVGKETAPKPGASAGGAEKFLVKVNGKLRELSRDDAIRELQKGFASRENFEKSASRTRKTQELLKALADPDPERQDAALRDLGVDPDKIAERRIAARTAQAQMTPEQKRIAELEQEITKREQDAKTAAQRAEQERDAAIEKQTWERIESESLAAVDAALKAGELPAGITPADALFYMAEAAEMNLGYGLDLPPAELVAEAKQRITEARDETRQRIVTALDGDSLLDFLGPEAVNKVCRAAVAKYKSGGQPLQPLAKPAPIGESEEPKRKWIRPDPRPAFL